MDKRKLVLAGSSGLILLAVLAATYALVFHGGQGRHEACIPSTVAALALKQGPDPAAREQILVLDKTFGAQYGQACLDMCQQRTQLAERLGTAPGNDAEAQRLLNLINAQQAYLEKLTWQHLLAVRDRLPAPARAEFVQAVQKQWGQAVSRMQHQLTMTGGCSLPGPGNPGREQPQP
jgi:hypothetical protein